jgi:hypothetical protein
VLHWRLTKTNTHTATLFAKPTPLNINLGSDRFAMFNKKWDIPECKPENDCRRGNLCSDHSVSPH